MSDEIKRLGAAFQSIRLEMFELYEAGADFPLVITSDRTLLIDLHPTDRIVVRHWVREGGIA
jgi:hypothetical protein